MLISQYLLCKQSKKALIPSYLIPRLIFRNLSLLLKTWNWLCLLYTSSLYYKKISQESKQEKPFTEIIIQIGDKDNMGAETENGQLAKKILDEYIQGFQDRNPNLYVFSAHLHMDEATPHLHIDFVPFTTGSKRGLDTRVSMKGALKQQGFNGTGRSDTELNQWREMCIRDRLGMPSKERSQLQKKIKS